MTKTRNAMFDDLARSGITKPDVIKRLGTALLTAAEVQKRTKVDAAGYLIPYYGVDGKKLDFYRIRLLDDVQRKADPNKLLRYLQPPDTLPHLYLPPLLDWRKVVADINTEIVLTEGEKKAAAAAQHGVACAGLGGVWSWQARKKGLRMLPQLQAIPMKGRVVRVIFDSDVMFKPDVQKALNALSGELERSGAKVLISYLPQDEGKQGLDDFLLKHSVSELSQLETETLQSTSVLHKLNEMFFLLEENGEIYNANTLGKLGKQAAGMLSAPLKAVRFTANGGVQDAAALDLWLEWAQRRTYTKFIYEPGAPRVVEGALNRWPGWGTTPKRGNAALFDKLFQLLTPELTPEQRAWLRSWLAWPLQHPGAKLATAVLTYGRLQGTGKTLLGYTMQRIYGDNSSVINQENLYSPYNDWLVDKQFIMGEEITGSEKRRHADILKSLITQHTVLVSKKYEHPFTLRDTANYYLTSNHSAALYLESSDRRFFINHASQQPESIDFYDEYIRWLDEDGAANVMYHLLNSDTGAFRPNDKAPMTESKELMIAGSLNRIETVLSGLATNPDDYLVDPVTQKPLKVQLASLQTIVRLIDPFDEFKPPISPIRVAVLLKHYGIDVKKRLQFESGGQRINDTVYAVRNVAEWRKASWTAWREHYADARRSLPSLLSGASTQPAARSKIAP